MKKLKPTALRRTRSWRDTPGATHRKFNTSPSPESLHPGPETIIQAIIGNRNAREISNAYAFRFPVTIVEVLPCA